MDFRELLQERRMVRHYDPEPVPRETLERICRTVRRAPSGGFSQGQRLIVVTDAEARKKIADLLHEDEWVEQGREPWLSVAPAHIVVCTREQDYHDRYNEPDKLAQTGGIEIGWPAPFWFVDAGAALMLVLLAAIDEGLAAAVYGVQVEDEPRWRDLLGIPGDLRIVAGVTLGHGAPDPEWSKRTSRATQRRRAVDELVHWNFW